MQPDISSLHPMLSLSLSCSNGRCRTAQETLRTPFEEGVLAMHGQLK